MNQDRRHQSQSSHISKAFPTPLLNWKSIQESKGNTLNSSVPVCLIPANTTVSGGAAFPATRR